MCVSRVSFIGVSSGVGCSPPPCWHLPAHTDRPCFSFPLIRYHTVAPCWWTDPLLSKLRELPSLAGKLLVRMALDTLPTKNWASITARFLSDKRFAEEGGGRGITKLNNTCPLGLAICPPLHGPEQGWQLGDGLAKGAGVGVAAVGWTTSPGFLRCHATRATDHLSSSLLPDVRVMCFSHVKILNYPEPIVTVVQTTFQDEQTCNHTDESQETVLKIIRNIPTTTKCGLTHIIVLWSFRPTSFYLVKSCVLPGLQLTCILKPINAL